MIYELNKTFITPIDREDLFALSRTVDDVLDYAYSTLEEVELLKVTPTGYMQRIASLTPRENDVLLPLVQGYTNREIAEQLGISVKTIDLYRSRVMKHMQAQTLADLVGMAIAADLVDPLALRGAAVSY